MKSNTKDPKTTNRYLWNKQITDFHLLKLLLVGLGFGSQTNVCGFSRQNICSVVEHKASPYFESPWQTPQYKTFKTILY